MLNKKKIIRDGATAAAAYFRSHQLTSILLANTPAKTITHRHTHTQKSEAPPKDAKHPVQKQRLNLNARRNQQGSPQPIQASSAFPAGQEKDGHFRPVTRLNPNAFGPPDLGFYARRGFFRFSGFLIRKTGCLRIDASQASICFASGTILPANLLVSGRSAVN